MTAAPIVVPLLAVGLALAGCILAAIACVRSARYSREAMRPPEQAQTMAAEITFTDDQHKVIAVISSDGTTQVYQPDKIKLAANGLLEHLATEAAREAAEREFGSTP